MICLDNWGVIFEYSLLEDKMSIQSLNRETFDALTLKKVTITHENYQKSDYLSSDRFRNIDHLTLILSRKVTNDSIQLSRHKHLSKLTLLNSSDETVHAALLGDTLMIFESLAQQSAKCSEYNGVAIEEYDYDVLGWITNMNVIMCDDRNDECSYYSDTSISFPMDDDDGERDFRKYEYEVILKKK